MSRDFRVIDGCPCPTYVAAQVYMVLRQANMTASSIYRGSDAAAILHKHGKRTQAEIHRDMPNISNPEGESQHDLHSDGVANRGPVGRPLFDWEVGVDSGANDQVSKNKIEAAAHSLGWKVKHPYSRGVEGHHWCFAEDPHSRNLKQHVRIMYLRARLPRS